MPGKEVRNAVCAPPGSTRTNLLRRNCHWLWLSKIRSPWFSTEASGPLRLFDCVCRFLQLFQSAFVNLGLPMRSKSVIGLEVPARAALVFVRSAKAGHVLGAFYAIVLCQTRFLQIQGLSL